MIPVNGKRRAVQLITKFVLSFVFILFPFRKPNVPFKVDEIKTRCSENRFFFSCLFCTLRVYFSRSPYVERAVIIMAYYLLPGVVDNLEMCYQLKNALTDDEHMINKRKQQDSVMAKVKFDYYKYVEDAQIKQFMKYLTDL